MRDALFTATGEALVLLTHFQRSHLLNQLTIAALHPQTHTLFDMIIKSAADTIGADGGVLMMLDDAEQNLRVRSLTGFYPAPLSVPEVVKPHSADER